MIEYHNWDGRIDDPEDTSSRRIHQVVQVIKDNIPDTGSSGFALVGYACDEGVRRNQGRIGARQGPDAIRKAISSMAYDIRDPIYDLGNCLCPGTNMEMVQQRYAKLVSKNLRNGQKVVGLGGGHDIAYGSFLGIQQFLKKKDLRTKLGIINVDAHFDLRRPNPQTNSGTPFYQIANDLGKEHFHYLPIGIQTYSNTRILFDTADNLGVQPILRSGLRFNFEVVLQGIQKFIESVDHIYLTIDLDALDSSHCPGVSAPATDGLSIAETMQIIHPILDCGKVSLVDIAELNPKYDIDNRTAKVAAYILYELLKRWK
ncbi:MAG: formimidoylglutamase [Bacteroidia bacterium]|nr:formimidoylglutamase [Bacteroidia bacterium]